jgi:serine/threonine-protein kinase RsbW
MSNVELTFSPLTSHVRTARLVAVTFARRIGVAEELLDEVRLAVGEACSHAVENHQLARLTDPVTMTLSDDPDSADGTAAGWFSITVTDRAGITAVADATAETAMDTPAPLALAVIQGLVDEVQLDTAGGQLRIGMRWPLPTSIL